MRDRRFMTVIRLALALAVMSWGTEQASAQSQPKYPDGPVPSPKGDGSVMNPMRRMRHEDRFKAALKALERRKANEAAGRITPDGKPAAKPAPKATPAGGASMNGVKGAAISVLRMAMAQVGTPDMYGGPNYANSKLPVATCSASAGTCQKDSDCPGYAPPFMVGINQFPGGETCTGAVVSGGIRKFVDTLPGLCALGTNTLDCIPLASPDTTTFPGADYYELGLKDYTHRWHTDLPTAALTRGYYQKNPNSGFTPYDPNAATNHYLGPLILAYTDRPVRMTLVNELGFKGDGSCTPTSCPPGAEGNLFIPVDKHISGVGLGPLGPNGGSYSENRATIHLHGGNTPWISDGTQHQWITPKGEPSPYKKGLSVEYVPDMWFDGSGNLLPPTSSCQGQQSCLVTGASTNPGDGKQTFYYTNQQSGRLMFYHDHAYGITRLNVIAGEAAGYLLVNPPDEDALAAAGAPGTLGAAFDLGHVIPLVFQDRTFVPPAAQLAQQDPTWDVAKWGGEDQLWFPHVYMTNQWPGNPDLSNTNPFGRWDYGPWFHPAQTTLTEVSWDGAVIDHPLTQPCNSIAAITPLNLTGATDCPTINNPSLVPESFFDTPTLNGVAYPKVNVEPRPYRFQFLNASNERNVNLSMFLASAQGGTEVTLVDASLHLPTSPVPLCTPTAPKSAVTGLPVGCWPADWPTNGRQGGVPDPATAGPMWIQIGSEAGLLPAPALIPPMPVGYEANPRNIVIGNVSTKGLFVGPAERADVIADFSAFAGKTLILYNDAPAPVPAGDARQDYYTGMPDFTLNGGSPTVHAGYGPNTRTIMQINVAASATGAVTPVNVAALTTAMNQRFVASQLKPIVPEAAYNGLYGANYTNTYVPITQFGSLTFTPVGSATQVSVPVQSKALHELFSTDYGRMNSLLAMEVPFTNWLNQTTIPFANFDPTTEFITDNQPQIWRVTHNGVDTHTIHFHLLNVQILNRVGWDGQIRAPDANELGWKESVRMNPLEDIFIAARPVRQTLPWAIPDKWRPLDVDRCVAGSAGCSGASQFTGVDVHNNPITVSNTMTNFGWEYVWHCHLLGHEEEDMLRAEVFVVAPETPSGAAAVGTGANPLVDPPVSLTWTDNSKSAMTWNIQRDTDPLFSAPTSFSQGETSVGPRSVSFTDSSAKAGTTYYYRVMASKSLSSLAYTGADQGSSASPYVASSGWSNVATFPGPLPKAGVAPTSLAFGNQLVGTVSAPQTVTLSNTPTAPSTSPLAIFGITVVGANPADFVQTTTCTASLPAGTSCAITITFKPTSVGTKAASVNISTNDPTNPTLSVSLTGAGIAPSLAVSAVAPFGNVLVGTTGSQTVTVSNTGSADVTGLTVAVTGAAEFGQTTTCTGALAQAASCNITLTFSPTATGAKTGTLTVSAAAPATPLAFSLSGTGVAPIATVSPTSLTFAPQGVNTVSAAKTATLSNTGTAPLSFTIAVAGTEFAQTSTCVSPLAAGASCTISVTFRPAAAGARTSTLTVSAVAPATPQTIALSGTGTALNLSTTVLAFGTQQVGSASAASRVALTNQGATALAVGPFTVSGTNAADFSFTTSCGASLASLSTCQISVRFTPAAIGLRSASLNVASNDPGGLQIVSLTGTGVAPGLNVSLNALTFSSTLNTTSAAQVVTLSNTGLVQANLNGISIGGTNPNQFARTTTCGGSLAVGASCTISVTFRPTSTTTPKLATLTVNAAAPATAQTVSLTGNVLVPGFSVVPSSMTFGSATAPLPRGSINTQLLTLTNTSTLTLPLPGNPFSIAGSGNFSVPSETCGASLAPGASCAATVRFRPAAPAGQKNATVTVRVNGGAPSQTVPLTGFGQ